MFRTSSTIFSSEDSDNPTSTVAPNVKRKHKRKNNRLKAVGKVVLLFVRSKKKTEAKTVQHQQNDHVRCIVDEDSKPSVHGDESVDSTIVKKGTIDSKSDDVGGDLSIHGRDDIGLSTGDKTSLTVDSKTSGDSNLSIVMQEDIVVSTSTKTDVIDVHMSVDRDLSVLEDNIVVSTCDETTVVSDPKTLGDDDADVFFDVGMGKDEDWITSLDKEETKKPVFTNRDLFRIRKAVVDTQYFSRLLTLHFQEITIHDCQNQVRALLQEKNQREADSIQQLDQMIPYGSNVVDVSSHDTIIALHNAVRFNQKLLSEHDKLSLAHLEKLHVLFRSLRTIVSYRKDTMALLESAEFY
jgi:hypothetical protein